MSQVVEGDEAPPFQIKSNPNKQKAPTDKRQELRDSAQLDLYKTSSNFPEKPKKSKITYFTDSRKLKLANFKKISLKI